MHFSQLRMHCVRNVCEVSLLTYPQNFYTNFPYLWIVFVSFAAIFYNEHKKCVITNVLHTHILYNYLYK